MALTKRAKLLMSDVLFGSAPFPVRICPVCEDVEALCARSQKYDWARELTCKKCIPLMSWYICVACVNQRVHMRSEKQLHRHFLHYHKKREINVSICESCITSEQIEDFGCPKVCSSSDIKKNFTRIENGRYFSSEFEGVDGISYLVGRCCFQDDSIGNEIEKTDIDINFALSKLCLALSRNERDMLGEILYLIHTKYTFKVNKAPREIHLPQSASMIRSRFMEGAYAFIPNLPHPEIQVCGDIAFVSITECVADLLAHGINIESIGSSENQTQSTISKVEDSLRVQEILTNSQRLEETPDFVVGILEWSDAFQPNTSSKQNRGSVHIKTISFLMPLFSLWRSHHYTYCVSIGQGKVNRTVVEEEFRVELERFQRSPLPKFFSKAYGRIVSVYLDIICVLQDQPERRSNNCLAYGNSNYHARWGWSCDFKAIFRYMQSCEDCQYALNQEGFCRTECPKCISWSLSSDHSLCRYSPPSNYPVMNSDDCDQLTPFALTHEKLIKAISLTNEKVTSAEWSIANARAYLSTYCLNTETVSDVIFHSANCHLAEQIKNNENFRTEVAYEVVLRTAPELFQPWRLPASLCRNVKLFQYVDTIMHLLYLGITKTIMVDIHGWFTSHGKLSSFTDLSKNVYEEIQDLALPWCKALAYGSGRFGAHVSENYLACGRLMKWFYQFIEIIKVTDKTCYEDPKTPPEIWTRKMNCAWLQARGLPFDGKAKTVRNRVAEYMKNPNEIPALLPDYNESCYIAETMISSWVALLSRIMGETVNVSKINAVERHIKIFLNAYSEFDKVSSKQKYPGWLQHFNFLSLMNLPSQMHQFGPLRNLWEGGVSGESIIRFVKPELCMGFRKNWQSSLLRNVHRKRAMNIIDHNRNIQNLEICKIAVNVDNLKQYSGLIELQYELAARKPISCFIIGMKYYFVLLIDDSIVQIIMERIYKEYFGMQYFELSMKKCTLRLSDVAGDVQYGLLLPMKYHNEVNGNATTNAIYTVISNEWMEINENGEMQLPQVSGVCYNNECI